MDQHFTFAPGQTTIAPAQLHIFGPNDWRPAPFRPVTVDTYGTGTSGQQASTPAPPIITAPPSPRTPVGTTMPEEESAFEEAFNLLYPDFVDAAALFPPVTSQAGGPAGHAEAASPQNAVPEPASSRQRTGEESTAPKAKARFFCNVPADRTGITDTPHECNKSYGRKSDLKRHLLRISPNAWPYPCTSSNCGRRFARPGDLKAHMRSLAHNA